MDKGDENLIADLIQSIKENDEYPNDKSDTEKNDFLHGEVKKFLAENLDEIQAFDTLLQSKSLDQKGLDAARKHLNAYTTVSKRFGSMDLPDVSELPTFESDDVLSTKKLSGDYEEFKYELKGYVPRVATQHPVTEGEFDRHLNYVEEDKQFEVELDLGLNVHSKRVEKARKNDTTLGDQLAKELNYARKMRPLNIRKYEFQQKMIREQLAQTGLEQINWNDYVVEYQQLEIDYLKQLEVLEQDASRQATIASHEKNLKLYQENNDASSSAGSSKRDHQQIPMLLQPHHRTPLLVTWESIYTETPATIGQFFESDALISTDAEKIIMAEILIEILSAAAEKNMKGIQLEKSKSFVQTYKLYTLFDCFHDTMRIEICQSEYVNFLIMLIVIQFQRPQNFENRANMRQKMEHSQNIIEAILKKVSTNKRPDIVRSETAKYINMRQNMIVQVMNRVNHAAKLDKDQSGGGMDIRTQTMIQIMLVKTIPGLYFFMHYNLAEILQRQGGVQWGFDSILNSQDISDPFKIVLGQMAIQDQKSKVVLDKGLQNKIDAYANSIGMKVGRIDGYSTRVKEIMDSAFRKITGEGLVGISANAITMDICSLTKNLYIPARSMARAAEPNGLNCFIRKKTDSLSGVMISHDEVIEIPGKVIHYIIASPEIMEKLTDHEVIILAALLIRQHVSYLIGIINDRKTTKKRIEEIRHGMYGDLVKVVKTIDHPNYPKSGRQRTFRACFGKFAEELLDLSENFQNFKATEHFQVKSWDVGPHVTEMVASDAKCSEVVKIWRDPLLNSWIKQKLSEITDEEGKLSEMKLSDE